MKIKKRFVALALASIFAFSGLTDINIISAKEVDPKAKIILPDLKNLEQPKSIGNDTSTNQLKEFKQTDLQPINGIPNSLDIPKSAKALKLVPHDTQKSFAGERLISPGMKVGDSRNFYNLDKEDGTELNVTLAAIGENCRVFVDKNTSEANKFLPTGTTVHTNAKYIADEFDKNIYPMMSNVFGEIPKVQIGTSYTDGKLNIVLYDIDEDGDSDGQNGYTAGYFYGVDFFNSDISNNFYSNEDTIIYMDIGKNQGYANFSLGDEGKISFSGTIAHEMQHLNNFSNYIMNFSSLITQTGDPDGEAPNHPPTSTWLNEGLSGLADVFYLNSKGYYMGNSHLDAFLMNYFEDNVGYVPTSPEWRSVEDMKILSNYGASSILMQEFYKIRGNLEPILSSKNTGYFGSMKTVGAPFGADGFNTFFDLANLNVVVDTPDDTIAQIKESGNVVYTSSVAKNMWDYRTQRKFPSQSLRASTNLKNNGKRYYSETFLADSIGAGEGRINVTLPQNPKANYYIITPFDTVGINDRQKWNSVGKIAGKLKAGVNSIQVGTDNIFAILAISHNSVVDETFSYAVLNSETTGITVSKPPVTTFFTEGSNLSLSGMEVTINYDSGNKVVVEQGDFSKHSLTTNPADRTKLTTKGQQNIQIVHSPSGFSTTQIINVIPQIKEIEITSPPTKTIYEIGEPLNLNGMTVTINKSTDNILVPFLQFSNYGLLPSIINGIMISETSTSFDVTHVDSGIKATQPLTLLLPVREPVIDTNPDTEQTVSSHTKILVTLSSETSGASITYTLNGSEPTISSSKYTEPFEIDSSLGETIVIHARGFKDGMAASTTVRKIIGFYDNKFQVNISSDYGGNIITGKSGAYEEGHVIDLAAQPLSNYTFGGWSTSSGGTFLNSKLQTTKFTVPPNATNIKATFIYNGSSSTPSTSRPSTSKPSTNTSSENTSTTTTYESTEKDVMDINGSKFNFNKINFQDEKHVFEIKPKLDGSASVLINPNILESINNKNNNFVLEFATPNAKYLLPSNILKISNEFSELLTKNNLKNEDVSLRINISEIKSEVGQFAFEFNIEVLNNSYNNNVIGKLTTFKNPIVRYISLPNDFKIPSNLFVALKVNDDSKKEEFVPHKFIKEKEKQSFKISSNTNSVYILKENKVEFKDIKSDFWAKPFIDKAASKSLVNGVGNGLYLPQKSISRAEFAQMIASSFYFQPYTEETKNYVDVLKKDWYYTSVMNLKNSGIFDKFDKNNFNPNNAISREEMAYVLYKVMIYSNQTSNSTELPLSKTFSDYKEVNQNYANEIEFIVGHKLMNGMGNNKFEPKAQTTRAQAATVLINLLQKLDMIDK